MGQSCPELPSIRADSIGQTPHTLFAQGVFPGERLHLTGGSFRKPGGTTARSHQTRDRPASLGQALLTCQLSTPSVLPPQVSLHTPGSATRPPIASVPVPLCQSCVSVYFHGQTSSGTTDLTHFGVGIAATPRRSLLPSLVLADSLLRRSPVLDFHLRFDMLEFGQNKLT